MSFPLFARIVLFSIPAALPLAAAPAGFPPLADVVAPLELRLGAGEPSSALRPADEGSIYTSEPLAEPRVDLASARSWREASHLVVDVLYQGPRTGLVRFAFFHAGSPRPRGVAGFSVLAGLPARLVLPLSSLDGRTLKLPRTPNTLRNGVTGQPVDLARLERVTLDLKQATGPQTLQIFRAALVSSAPAHPVHDFELVDELGQWATRDWPGKTHGVADLKAFLTYELSSAEKATYPTGWTRFGGDASRRFAATGFFRLERDERRWWLVDPEGAAFFSVGLTTIGPGSAGPIVPGTASLYARLPEAGPEGGVRPGTEGERRSRRSPEEQRMRTADFMRENLVRAFGEDWRSSWETLTRGRLLGWRFNTIGNWGDQGLITRARIPYVLQLHGFPTTPVALYRDFPDVFDPAYETSAAGQARSLEPAVNDPFMVGYFMINEPRWGFGLTNLAARMLEAAPGSFSRREFARWIKDRYRGDLDGLKRAWGLELASFHEFVSGMWARLEERSDAINDDLQEFSHILIRRYHEVPIRAARAVDPNHLNLGFRYAYVANAAMLAGGELCDVFSINAYAMRPPLATVDTIAQVTGRPVMIGEFHFGALDRGLPSTGLRGVLTQADRGAAYRHYVEQGAAHPAVVGVHYFQLNDQPLLGRGDGENHQIGMVDVCHRPYAEFAAEVRSTNEGIYEVAAGRRAPLARAPEEIPNNLIETTSLNARRDAARQ